jgi:hypothetical protein
MDLADWLIALLKNAFDCRQGTVKIPKHRTTNSFALAHKFRFTANLPWHCLAAMQTRTDIVERDPREI